MQAHDSAKCFNQTGFSQSRQANQQPVTATKKRRERQIDNPFLADETLGNRRARLRQFVFQRLDTSQQIGVITHGKTPYAPLSFR